MIVIQFPRSEDSRLGEALSRASEQLAEEVPPQWVHLQLRAHLDTWVALCGAEVPIQLDGIAQANWSRFAVRAGQVLAVGFAFAAQEVDAVPIDAFDQRLDAVVTEKGVTVFA